MLGRAKKNLLPWGAGAVVTTACWQAELRPDGAIGAMPCHPDRLRGGLEPYHHLCVGIALRIPRQEATLAGRRLLQHGRDVLRAPL